MDNQNKRTVCLILLIIAATLVILSDGSGKNHVVPTDPLRAQTLAHCQNTVPDQGFRDKDLMNRGGGRYQAAMTHLKSKTQVLCVTFMGKVELVDTAIIQPGNGQLSPVTR